MKKFFSVLTAVIALAFTGNAQKKANTFLSNLTNPTAINHSLSPAASSSINLGSSSKKWKNIFLSGTVHSDSIKVANGGVSVLGGGIQSYNNAGYGVYGNGNIVGVYGAGTGTNIHSIGVQGGSDYIGVFGGGNTAGVWGESGNVGIYGVSSNVGIAGTGDSYGVNAYSLRGIGVAAFSSIGTAITGSTAYGFGANLYSLFNYALRAETINGDFAGAFYGDVYTTGMYLPSDKNLKENVQDFNSAMNIINKLKPKYYQYKNDAKYASIHLPKGNHYGLIAQDLEQVLPGLVKQSAHQIETRDNIEIQLPADGKHLSDASIAGQKVTSKESVIIKAVNYTELIPIMIKGMQELNAKNEDLQSQVNELKALLVKSGYTSDVTGNGYLKQNVPNPANNNTVINYYLPRHIGDAEIRITDEKGSTLKVYNVPPGEGQANIKSSELASGTYTYTLYVNNKQIDSKQMIIIK
jgi:hypothetical protein